ncbi:hypothetical protein [Streptomyces spinoverrucosus]|uniref:hypothetical protein n=1 Tax=Streptomyces spinoverrucosus TaxID=284043 RepID=UPI00142F1011|nr:hypothetical protein [Streptomyces spinoverrucosus]GHB39027.1 hypothetical protein GCM10010397_06130 [Streptomyces spinoverrucosus]
MTREERRIYISKIVDAAPPLSAEDADLLRALIPMGGRLAAERAGARPQPATARRAAA